jgi:hypothetical protein
MLYDDEECNVEIEFIIGLTNGGSAVPTIMPSAAPSNEPSSSAAPSGSKKGKGKTNSIDDGKGKKTKDAKEGKGKDSNDFSGAPGTIILGEGHELFIRMGNGDSCGIDKLPLNVFDGMEITPGETLMLPGNRFSLNVCECHSALYFLGVLGFDTSISSGKGKGKSSGTCFVPADGKINVIKSAAPSPEPSDPPSMEPTLSAPPSWFPSESPSAEPSVSMAPSCSGKKCKGGKGKKS